ncbi:MAG: hypothetical protein APG11_01861 [Candidatus Methanofastidiosum methylothiophilum]|uniref:Uncharacterized protein n=1 Tax=Candidatus Methanofastidiosum methylothiophilum TaxID=1705564 RepID=A0A150INM2_9EURY|nr:MAG: hypothetical protein APG11_01861 [Candidatus Methanofastidiosum methylthiophilus]
MVRELLKNLNQRSILTLPILSILVLGMIGCVFEKDRLSQGELLILGANQELLKSTTNLDRYLDNILELNEEDLAAYIFDFKTYDEGIAKGQYFVNTYNFFEDHKSLLGEVEAQNKKALELYQQALNKDIDSIQKEYVLMKISVINKYNEAVNTSKNLLEKQETFRRYLDNSLRQSMTTCESCGGAPKSATHVGWKTALPADWMNANIFSLKDQISQTLAEAKAIDLEAEEIWAHKVKSNLEEA